QRLKDKLGTRSLPSSEVELHALPARLVGEEGRGVQTIIRMVNHTRLDCLLGSAASIRWGTAQAVHHARHRSAFGRLLAEQPAMRNVLADLQLESEAATAAALRIARAYDDADAPFRRFATAVMKYWVCKRAPHHAIEALECLGGNGYVEESGMPRLLRDSPLNSIWEGSGNVAALDVLRALAKEPQGLPAFLAEVESAAGANGDLDTHVDRLKSSVAALAGDGGDPQWQARALVEDLGVALQASLLVRHAPSAVADAFCAARLRGEGGRVLGTLPQGVDADAIMARALPA
ncbi:MAG: acyl-CoA dehydrogenase family protein, partial [Thermoleophilaceae bacterium]